MTLAQRVRDQRYTKGWGPDELANRAAISRTALYQIESGKTEQPRAATLRRIALALEIPTEALLGQNLGVVSLPWASPPPGPSPMTRSADPSTPVRFRLDDSAHFGRDGDLGRMFQELLASPLGEGLARIVEESYRILPRTVPGSRY